MLEQQFCKGLFTPFENGTCFMFLLYVRIIIRCMQSTRYMERTRCMQGAQLTINQSNQQSRGKENYLLAELMVCSYKYIKLNLDLFIRKHT